ncbi:MAG: tetratricopeptide repeat protein [Candidatus Symbiothrix sp.]|jgi:tetratricopeptide (TPR) repeat protein|nr:tetratricopeptide repeat protein [Candidatus Symbiothrix sp.]
MKKTLLTAALCLICASSFGQQKLVNTVKSDLKGSKPNFGELRTQIKSALANPETANSAEAWFVAGDVENKLFDTERLKELVGKKADEAVMYTALDASTAPFLKSDELDQLPDEKGKVKSKFRKEIKSILTANRPYYINAGSYFYEKQDYVKAYNNFKFFGDIPALAMFEGDKNTKFEELATDTNSLKIRYYAGVSASLIPDHNKAIEIYEQIKDYGFNDLEIYKQLASEYVQNGDSVDFQKTLEAGVTKFPTETYFLLNLINIQVNDDRSDDAIAFLNKAIAADPNNSQFLDVLGLVYEKKNDIPQAIVNIEKALAINPDNAEALSHLGRLYYNSGVEKRAESASISDSKKYAEAKKDFEADFKTALPYFEKAYALNNQDSDAIFALRNIYYQLQDNDNYEKWDKIYTEK